MEDYVIKRLEEQDKKLNDIYKSIEKMRKYFLWTLIISVGFIIIPLIGLMFLIPYFLKTLSASIGGF